MIFIRMICDGFEDHITLYLNYYSFIGIPGLIALAFVGSVEMIFFIIVSFGEFYKNKSNNYSPAGQFVL